MACMLECLYGWLYNGAENPFLPLPRQENDCVPHEIDVSHIVLPKLCPLCGFIHVHAHSLEANEWSADSAR